MNHQRLYKKKSLFVVLTLKTGMPPDRRGWKISSASGSGVNTLDTGKYKAALPYIN